MSELYVLSRRHSRPKGWCKACGSTRRVAKLLYVDNVNARDELSICAPCAREAMRAASELPKKARRRP